MHTVNAGRLMVGAEFFGFEAEEILRACDELMCDPSESVRGLVRDGITLRAWLAAGSDQHGGASATNQDIFRAVPPGPASVPPAPSGVMETG